VIIVVFYGVVRQEFACNISDIWHLQTQPITVRMASKSKPVNQQKCRKFGLTNGPLRATQSFGLALKKAADSDRLQPSALCGSENSKLVVSPCLPDTKDTRRSSSPDSPSVLRRGR